MVVRVFSWLPGQLLAAADGKLIHSILTDWDDTISAAAASDVAARQPGEERPYIIVLVGSNAGEMFKITAGEMVLGRGTGVDLRLVDEGISRFHCRIRANGDEFTVEDLASRNGTFLNGERVQAHRLEDGDKIQLGRATVLKFSLHDQIEESFQRRMFDSALRDGLTGAYNKRYLLDRLQSEMRFALRHGSRLGLLMLDLDRFKHVNDAHGHLAGDRALTDFCGFVLDAIRHEDVLARYGGEEFVVLSRITSAVDCLQLAERLRRGVEQLEVEHHGIPISITVSIGVACLPDLGLGAPNDLLDAADRALYRAKALGRNRVVVCTAELLLSSTP